MEKSFRGRKMSCNDPNCIACQLRRALGGEKPQRRMSNISDLLKSLFDDRSEPEMSEKEEWAAGLFKEELIKLAKELAEKHGLVLVSLSADIRAKKEKPAGQKPAKRVRKKSTKPPATNEAATDE